MYFVPTDIFYFAQSEFQKKPSHTLFHYTNENGVSGILSSGKIWATKITFLNDTTELSYAINLAKESVVSYINKYSNKINKAIDPDELLQHLLQGLGFKYLENIYSISFTESEDLLSQWRAYSEGATGYSIGFDSNCLEVIGKIHGFGLSPCIYDVDAQRNIIDRFFDFYLPKIGAPDDEFSIVQVLTDFVRIGSFIKNPSFSEEMEWRLISEITPPANRVIDWVDSSKNRRRFPLCNDHFNPQIPKIICGPKSSNEFIEGTLKRLLIQRGCNDTVVVKSKIPLR